ncbi:hypothetical protein JL720_1489 [Aureococcus anophagefferens]|nr:hypothetical protein JL720_1489 [Aureococcus anophagefferens]
MQKSIEGLPAPAHGGAMGPKQEKKKRASYFGGSGKKAALLPALEERVLVSLALVYDFLNARVKSSPWLYRDGGSKKAQMAVAVAIREGTIGAQLAGGKLDLDGDVPAVCAAVKQTLANHAPITGYGHYGAFLDAGGAPTRSAPPAGPRSRPSWRALHELCGHLLAVSAAGPATQLATGQLAHVFAPLLLRASEDKGASPRADEARARTCAASILALPWTAPASRETNVERSKSWTADRPSLDGAAPVFAGAPELPSSATAPALSSAPPRRDAAGAGRRREGPRALWASGRSRTRRPTSRRRRRPRSAAAAARERRLSQTLPAPSSAAAAPTKKVLDVQARTLKVTWPSFAPRPKDEDLQFVFKKFGPLIQCGVGLKKRPRRRRERRRGAARAPPVHLRAAAPGGPERTLKVKWNGDVERPSEDMLRTVFGHYGAVLKCGIGKRSAALVQFADADAAAAAERGYAGPWRVARLSGSGDGSEPGTTDDDRTDDAPPPPPTAAEVRRRSLAVTRADGSPGARDLGAALAGLDAAPVVAAAVAGGHATVLLASEEDAAKCAAELEGTEFAAPLGAGAPARRRRGGQGRGAAARRRRGAAARRRRRAARRGARRRRRARRRAAAAAAARRGARGAAHRRDEPPLVREVAAFSRAPAAPPLEATPRTAAAPPPPRAIYASSVLASPGGPPDAPPRAPPPPPPGAGASAAAPRLAPPTPPGDESRRWRDRALAAEEELRRGPRRRGATRSSTAGGAAPSRPRSARGATARPRRPSPRRRRRRATTSPRRRTSAAAASVGTLSTADVAQLLACQAQTLGDEIRATIKELVGGGAAPAPRARAAAAPRPAPPRPGAYGGGAYGGAPARRAYVAVGPEFNPTSPALREWWGNITSADRPVVLNISTSDRPVY